MKFSELQEELKKKKHPTAGLKVVLLDIPTEALRKESPVHCNITTVTEKKSSSANNTAGVYSISEDSWWNLSRLVQLWRILGIQRLN